MDFFTLHSSMLLLMLGVLFAGASIMLAFLARVEAVPAALVALIAGSYCGSPAAPDSSTLLFWTMATVLVVGIAVLLPKEVSRARSGVYFLAAGAVAGMAVGMISGRSAAVILATAAGIVSGAIVYGNTRGGRPLGFPSRQYFNYVLAKGLPLLVTFSMLGLFFARALQSQI